MPGNMPAVMACEKMHARIPVATCVGRQTKGIKISAGDGQASCWIPYECRDCEAGRAMLERTGAAQNGREENVMTKKCVNCGREKSIVKEGRCFVCSKACKGLEGEAKDKALAAIRLKIAAGEIHHGGGRRKQGANAPEGAAPAPEVRIDRAPARPSSPSGAAVVPIGMPGSEIPITLRLTIEVAIRLVGAAG